MKSPSLVDRLIKAVSGGRDTSKKSAKKKSEPEERRVQRETDRLLMRGNATEKDVRKLLGVE